MVSSATLEKGQQIILGPMGLELPYESQREGSTKDGHIYFGRKKSIKKLANDPTQIESTTTKTVVNDFVIPSKNPQTAEQQRGRHFQIRFDPESHKYFIRDLGIGHGVFARLDSPTVLKDNMIVNVGEAHIVVNLLHRDESGEVGVSMTGDEEA